MDILKYEYYDTPDGNDLFKKLVATGKYVGAFGIVLSTYDVMLYSKPKGYLPILTRYAVFLGPMLGISAVFTSTTFLATNLRKKDDEVNYLLGGIAAGCSYGALKRNCFTGFKSSILLATIAMLKKNSMIEGYEFFPETNMRYEGGARYVKNTDWSLSKEIPGNWTRNPNEA